MPNIEVPINDQLMFDFVSEEGHMLELDESIEAIDAAIEYKNDRLLGVGSLSLFILLWKLQKRPIDFSNILFFTVPST